MKDSSHRRNANTFPLEKVSPITPVSVKALETLLGHQLRDSVPRRSIACLAFMLLDL